MNKIEKQNVLYSLLVRRTNFKLIKTLILIKLI